MIHQHIFASPKPGMTEAEFQRYWLEVHAVTYASRIPQIRKYKVDTRIDWPGEREPPRWSGIAEIWLTDEKEQLESLQSKEFLEGARLDEPRWAAFWNTQVVDTDAHLVREDVPETREAPGVKLVVLTKRVAGLGVEDFRRAYMDYYRQLADEVPALRRALLCFTRDSWYVVGEPRFDAVAHGWFATPEELARVLEGTKFSRLAPADHVDFLEPRYVFSMAATEHWIVGPEPR